MRTRVKSYSQGVRIDTFVIQLKDARLEFRSVYVLLKLKLQYKAFYVEGRRLARLRDGVMEM